MIYNMIQTNVRKWDAMHRPSISSIFVVLAMMLTLVAPLIVLFWPLFQISTFRFDRDNLLMTVPMQNYYLLGTALFILITLLFLLAWRRTKKIYVFVTIGVMIAGGIFYLSSVSYIQIHPAFVKKQNYHQEIVYEMEDLEEIIYEYGREENGQYIFRTKDKAEMIIPDSPLLDGEKKQKLRQAATSHNVEFIEREYGEE